MAAPSADNRYRAILDSLLEGFQIIGHDWTYIYVNPSAAAQGRATPGKLEGRKMWEAYPGIDRTPLFDVLKRCMADRTVAAFENLFTYADGRTAWFELRVEPAPEGICIHSYNIQSRKDAQAALERANSELESRVIARTQQLEAVNAELEAFSFSVSHDLGTPLRHVIGFADVLVQDAAERLTEDDKDSLMRITRAADRMNGMIAHLLEFSRLGRSTLNKERVNLGDIVQLARADLEPEIEGRAVEWSVPALPDVSADPALMRLAMVNLLSNALKYTRGRTPAQISIGTQREPDVAEIVVSVRDNGVGFDMRNSGRLFGVFQRLHSDLEFEGMGIGLANVRRIVTRHGGRIWADASLGGGATFYLTLPAESDAQHA